MARSLVCILSLFTLTLTLSGTAQAKALSEVGKAQIELTRAISESYRFPGLQKDGSVVACKTFLKGLKKVNLRKSSAENFARMEFARAYKLTTVRQWATEKEFIVSETAVIRMVGVEGAIRFKKLGNGKFVHCVRASKIQ